MANPSLQIGNDNWAIKEDNLLGYSTAGTRFVPQPITMTRASAGTRVNSSGLVETVELLGIEEVTNGDFTQLPLGTGWDAYTSGSSTVAFTEGAILSIDGSNSNVGVYQQNIFTNGVQYKIIVSVKATASFDAEIVESQGAATQTIIGTVSLTTSYQDFVFYFTGTGTNDLFIHRLYGETAGANQSIYIKEVSVKESTKNNLARVDYDGSVSSLLVEPERTNLVTYSEDFTSWVQIQDTTLTANSTTSPSGENDGTKFLSTGTGAKVRENFSAVSGTTYTLSVYCKNIDATSIRLLCYDGVNSFSNYFQSEVNTSTWTRISLTFTATNTATGQIQIARDLPDTQSAYFWGAQIEAGSYATSYIPTSGSTVTRNQDIFTRDGIGSLINSTEGVLFVEMAALSNTSTDRTMVSLSDGTTSNRVYIRYGNASNQIEGRSTVATANSGLTNYVVTNETDFHKVAYKWKLNDFALWIDGVEVSTGTGVVNSSDTLNKLSFDSGTGTQIAEGKVKQLQVYDTALTDTELATLTTI